MSAGNDREFIDFLQRKEKGGRPMKCPLLTMVAYPITEPISHTDRDCLKEECAWWSSELNQCDPTGLLPWFYDIGGHLEELVKKMPHEEQFRK